MKTTGFLETKTHGSPNFPYIVYRGKLPEYLQSYPIHWHNEMEIIYVLSGMGVITVQTNSYKVHTGDIILIQPGLLHSIEQTEDQEMEYFNILFDFGLLETKQSVCYEKYFRKIYEHKRLVPVYLTNDEPLSVLITPYIKDLIINRRERYTSHELMIKSYLYAIMYHINGCCVDSSFAADTLDKNYEKIKTVLLYIQNHYSKTISVADAAKMASYSPSYFSRLFRELTGKSFTQYLINYRLKHAAERLVSTADSVTIISEETGFCNLPYFVRSFKAKYGVSPTVYRKIVKKS